MSNVHGLFSNRDDDSDSSDDETNNRYVGGVDGRGGGSGLAVQPNTAESQSASSARDSILSSIRANASQATAADSTNPPRRTITMYRNSFTVDNGPERRLDDPNNAEFLKDLARGIVPKELMDGDGSGEDGSGGGGGGDATVGLIDKRHADYNADDCDCDDDHGHGQGPAVPRSFAGEGQSLGSTAAVATGGIISPTTATAETPTVNTAQPTTVIQIRLLNGRRLRVTINKC